MASRFGPREKEGEGQEKRTRGWAKEVNRRTKRERTKRAEKAGLYRNEKLGEGKPMSWRSFGRKAG